MLESITALASSLQTAAEMTKAMVDLRDAAAMNGKVIELQGIILSAQSSALSAQSDQFALLQRVRELEEEVARTKKWDAEAESYELKEVYIGVAAYVPKPNTDAAKTAHWLCANCFEQKNKSFLQLSSRSSIGDIYRCKGCNGHVTIHRGVNPSRPWNGIQ